METKDDKRHVNLKLIGSCWRCESFSVETAAFSALVSVWGSRTVCVGRMVFTKIIMNKKRGLHQTNLWKQSRNRVAGVWASRWKTSSRSLTTCWFVLLRLIDLLTSVFASVAPSIVININREFKSLPVQQMALCVCERRSSRALKRGGYRRAASCLLRRPPTSNSSHHHLFYRRTEQTTASHIICPSSLCTEATKCTRVSQSKVLILLSLLLFH